MGTQKTLLSVILHALIRFYGLFISPLLGMGKCRFVPNCSDYADEALEIHGSEAVPMIAKRLCRCHPFCGHGYIYDPVKKKD